MFLVDSSVWIDFFRGVETPQTNHLEKQITGGKRVLIGDLVLAEVLQGCDTDRDFEQLRRMMEPFRTIEIVGIDVAVEAARNYRALRSKGITVRKTIDTLIATRCIIDDLPLLYSDRDFDPFVTHLGLCSAMNIPE